MSRPGTPGSTTCAGLGGGVPLERRWSRLDHLRLAREHVLVVLLDAVLADAGAVHEAEEMGGERAVGAAAGLRVDPDRVRLEAQAGQRAVGRPRPGSRSAASASRSRARIRYGLARRELRRERRSRPCPSRPSWSSRTAAIAGSMVRGELGWRRDEPARDRRSWRARSCRSGRRSGRAGWALRART